MAKPAPRGSPRFGSSRRRSINRPRSIRPDCLVASEEVAGRGPASVVDVAPPQTPAFLRGFRALRHRDFRLFFVGQLISLTGTWMQSLAQSWLVLVLTNSPFALGLVGALQFLPVLLFSVLGGTIADRFRKRRLLLATQTAQMLLAVVLAVLVVENAVTYPDVLLLAFLLGLANSVDMPTRQAFVVELVGPADLLNAIALNSSLFNAARLVGPALAGLLIGAIGIAGCFFLNALSFLAVIAGLLLMRPREERPRQIESLAEVGRDLREGFAYVRASAPILGVVLLTGAIGTFGANFNVVAPILARDTLGVGAMGLGWLMAAMGLGSLIASLGLAYLGQAARPRLMLGSALAFSALELALAPVTSFGTALGLFAALGATMVVFSAVANSFIQLSVPHRLRGRVMSIYTTVFVGTTPIGNTLAGAIAEKYGASGPLFLGGLLSLGATLWFGRSLASARRS